MHQPYFEFHVFVCCNRRTEGHTRGSCAAKGSEALRDYMKQRVRQLGVDGVRINASGCLDRCELGPAVVIYPQGIWYSVKNTEDAEQILQRHLLDHGEVAELEMPPRGA